MTTHSTVPACAHAHSSFRGAPAMAFGQRDRDRTATDRSPARRGAAAPGTLHPLTLTAARRPLPAVTTRGITPLRVTVTGSDRTTGPAEAATACDGKGAAWANTAFGANSARLLPRHGVAARNDWMNGPGGADAPGGDRRPLFILPPQATTPCLAGRMFVMADHPRASAGLCEQAERIADTWRRVKADGRITADEDAEMTCLVVAHVTDTADHDEAVAVVVGSLRGGLESPRVVRLLRERAARLRLLRPAYGVIADGTLEEEAA